MNVSHNVIGLHVQSAHKLHIMYSREFNIVYYENNFVAYLQCIREDVGILCYVWCYSDFISILHHVILVQHNLPQNSVWYREYQNKSKCCRKTLLVKNKAWNFILKIVEVFFNKLSKLHSRSKTLYHQKSLLGISICDLRTLLL